MNDVWRVVRDERRALIADLEMLEDDQWEAPSLCAGWTVHDVVAHVIDTAKTTIPNFIWYLAIARFDFDRQNAQGVQRERASRPAETLDAFRRVVDRTTSPPAPRVSRVVEMIVHGEDIRRPLGLGHDYPIDAAADALRLQARTSPAWGGAKEQVDGITLAATDADVRLGSGPIVEGPVVSLLLAACGRSVALADLRGPGLPVLASRLVNGQE